ncbi:uncharacterized protein BDZ99DRAFT_99444 [Mytilinidion resinicola]|uniref:Ankyrin n=1 Tax=Mytilinidion resinicola TaxID=574789 RepID=A0A6A6YBE8_9PEZI|nr:uncharacterized protein BDZ99DRAFT_99444 [Mytilinidion resinicola]KAF2805833.1 hypothetical protein BDZ99DRAFT_99444 [Mytilinidion resinicola]
MMANQKEPSSYRAWVIRAVTNSICNKIGQTDDDSVIRNIAEQLCHLYRNADHFTYRSFQGCSRDNTILAAAAYLNYQDFTKKLLANGYDPEKNTPFGLPVWAAAFAGNNSVVELLLTSGTGVTLRKRCFAISGAANGGHLDTFNLLFSPRFGHMVPGNATYPFLKEGLYRTSNPRIFDQTVALLKPYSHS